MALTSAQYTRLRIQDQPLMADATYYGDGQASGFALPHANISSGSAMVLAAGAWSATGATFNASGYITFSGRISANSGFRVTYVHSTFSDDEVDEFISRGGSVNGASLEAVRTLMFDGLKRSRWMASDGTQHDDTAAMGLLNQIHDRLQREQEDAAIASGGVIGWGENQGNYS